MYTVKRAYNNGGIYIEVWSANGNIKEEYEVEIEENEVSIEYEVCVGNEKKIEVEMKFTDPNTYKDFKQFLESLQYSSDYTVAQKLISLVNLLVNVEMVKKAVYLN